MAEVTIKQFLIKTKPFLIEIIREFGAEKATSMFIVGDDDHPDLEFSVIVQCKPKLIEENDSE